MAPRIRKAPLLERLKAYLNPWDFFLWASEELSGSEWDEFWSQWSSPIGLALNFIFLIARANTHPTSNSGRDEVFGDYSSNTGSGWLLWFAAFVVQSLTLLSAVNAFYTFSRKRSYRLFEAPVDINPNSSSARRVHVNSTPLSSSPIRYISNILSASTAESRAHPDTTQDVWEVAVWDPKPLNLRLFCLFSPGHVLIYWIFLPLQPLDPRPSVTVVTTTGLAALLSVQLLLLQSYFSQQARDRTLIHKEVQHEYDTKFVHPSLNKTVRNVGTQVLGSRTPSQEHEVNTYTPTSYVNRGFQINPNPAYSAHVDPDGKARGASRRLQRIVSPTRTPSVHQPNAWTDFSSPLRSHTHVASRQPPFHSSAVPTPSGDGGNFGIYNHAQSPLRRLSQSSGSEAPRPVAKLRKGGSPLKRSSMPAASQIVDPTSARYHG